MTFHQAQECFREAITFINPKQDPVMFDLANGLLALAEASQNLEIEIQAIRTRLDRIP